MKQNQISTEQTEEKSVSRRKSYLSYIRRYPLYSTLLVLKDYEDQELYEECAIIRDALKEYRDTDASKFPVGLSFPMHINVYNEKSCQDALKAMNIIVEEKTAKEKATFIKLNLPVTWKNNKNTY